MAPDSNLSETILQLFSESCIRWTTGDLARKVREMRPGQDRKAVHQAIKHLVTVGRLIYTHHFSSSHLELNFKQPVQVSPRITLLPANSNAAIDSGCVGIKLQDGAAFGGGDHPTTRMSLQGIDHALSETHNFDGIEKMLALDVGTGSGILGLAALKLGVGKALGVDIDPVACHTARNNAALNNMSHRFEIGNQLPDPANALAFDLVLLNLRPPTVVQLLAKLKALSQPNAKWVLSGFRKNEQSAMKQAIEKVGGRCIWRAVACDWAAWVLDWS